MEFNISDVSIFLQPQQTDEVFIEVNSNLPVLFSYYFLSILGNFVEVIVYSLPKVCLLSFLVNGGYLRYLLFFSIYRGILLLPSSG